MTAMTYTSVMDKIANKVFQQRPGGVTLEVRPNGHMFFHKESRVECSWYSYPYIYHREGGPAVIAPYGYIAYRLDDEYHRTNGPAVVDPRSQETRYYVDGGLVSEEEFFLKYGIL